MAAARRILVLGGTGVVGRAVVGTLRGRGAAVVATWHRRAAGARDLAAALGDEHVQRLDLASVPELEAVVARAEELLGGLDALVMCAAAASGLGDGGGADLEAIDEAAWDALVNVELRGAFFACRAVARALRRSGGGDIVLLTSLDGVRSLPGPVHHAVSAAGLAGLVRSMAKALGPRGVRVNAVAPGLLGAGSSRDVTPERRADYEKHCGLRRLGRPEEVAAVVAHLALENTYVTGQTLVLDGAL